MKRLHAIWMILAAGALATTLPAYRAGAAPAGPAQTLPALTGVYDGTYRCGQGATSLKLSLQVTAGGEISGLFTFYLPPGTQKQAYTFSLYGLYDPRTAKFSLMPTRWETEHPANFAMVGMNGTFDSNELTGTIAGAGCTTFEVERNQAESARIAAVMAEQKSGAKPQAGMPTAVTSAAAAPAASSTAAAQAKPPAAAPTAARPQTAAGNREPPAHATQQSARGQAAAAPPKQSKAALSPEAQKAADAYEAEEARIEAELKDPNLHWHANKERATNSDVDSMQVAAYRPLFDEDTDITVTAACFRNGIRMLFLIDAFEDTPPQFEMYTDSSASDPSDDQAIDVPIRVDGGSVHTAKGYPEEKNGKLFNNYMGFVFYDPGFHQRVYDSNMRGDTTFNIRLDGALAPLVRQKAQTNADDAVATAGGPMSALLNAHSVRVELPVKDHSHPAIDLNPQDKVFHQYVTDCYGRLTAGSQPRSAASPATTPAAAQNQNASRGRTQPAGVPARPR